MIGLWLTSRELFDNILIASFLAENMENMEKQEALRTQIFETGSGAVRVSQDAQGNLETKLVTTQDLYIDEAELALDAAQGG